MVATALAVLTVAVMLGGYLSARLLRGEGAGSAPWIAPLHGLIGAAGFAGLMLALQGPPRGAAMGTGAFGAVAAALFASALIAGIARAIVVRRTGRRLGMVVAAHAGLAITGYVIFLAWASTE